MKFEQITFKMSHANLGRPVRDYKPGDVIPHEDVGLWRTLGHLLRIGRVTAEPEVPWKIFSDPHKTAMQAWNEFTGNTPELLAVQDEVINRPKRGRPKKIKA